MKRSFSSNRSGAKVAREKESVAALVPLGKMRIALSATVHNWSTPVAESLLLPFCSLSFFFFFFYIVTLVKASTLNFAFLLFLSATTTTATESFFFTRESETAICTDAALIWWPAYDLATGFDVESLLLFALLLPLKVLLDYPWHDYATAREMKRGFLIGNQSLFEARLNRCNQLWFNL